MTPLALRSLYVCMYQLKCDFEAAGSTYTEKPHLAVNSWLVMQANVIGTKVCVWIPVVFILKSVVEV